MTLDPDALIPIANHFYKGAPPARAARAAAWHFGRNAFAPLWARLASRPRPRLTRRSVTWRAGVEGDFVLLSLDRAKLGAEVKFEPAAPVGDAPPPDTAQLFPHLVRRRRIPALPRGTRRSFSRSCAACARSTGPSRRRR